MSCNNGTKKEMPCNYRLLDDGHYVELLGGKVSILTKVEDYDYDDNFLVVLQLPDYSTQKETTIISLAYGSSSYINKYVHRKVVSYEYLASVADSILQNDPVTNKIFALKECYWIISCKDSTQVYGPLSKQEYLRKRLELKAPKDLKVGHTYFGFRF